MTLTQPLADALNDQVTLELQASIVYRQLAIDMDALDLPGIAGWLRTQAEEEVTHANKFIDHLVDRGGHPAIQTITSQSTPAKTVLEAFEASLAHEKKVSEAIRELYRLAQREGDIDVIPLLNWFVEEQLEEEATVAEIIGQLKLVDDDGPGLLRLDEQLGSRPTGQDGA